MKKQKMNLANIQGKLSREEMKNVMGGDNPGEGVNCNTYWCTSNADCVDKSCGNRCFSINQKNRCTYI